MNLAMWVFWWSNDHLMRLWKKKRRISLFDGNWDDEFVVFTFWMFSTSSFLFDMFINKPKDHSSSKRLSSYHFPAIKSASAKNCFLEVFIFYEWGLLYKNVLARTIGFVWKILQTLQKKTKKNWDFQLFCRKNESNLRLIYKLRLNNIILQAINHVMSKENRFL